MWAFRLMLAAICVAVTPAAAAQTREDVALVEQLETLTEPCASLGRPQMNRRMHVLNFAGHADALLDWMLGLDPVRCPGMARAAAARIEAAVGTPERPGVFASDLRLAWRSAAEGLGRPRDPVMADRYRRMFWLYHHDDSLEFADWPAAARQQWLERPETVAVLRAHLALSEEGEYRQARMLAALSLLRGRPYYDPQLALRLLDRAYDLEGQADLLSNGTHMPPDYRRAGEALYDSIGGLVGDDVVQAALLRVGRRALAAARTEAQRGDALRILFAASIEGMEDSCALARTSLQAFPRVRLSALTDGETEQIAEEMYGEFDPIYVGDEPAVPRAVVLRGLIDPNGRLIYAEVDQSSGSVDRDRAALAGWAESAEDVDLSASARGRFAWVKLPAVAPARALDITRELAPRSLCR